MGTLKREVDRKDQSRDRKVQLNSLMNQMQEQGLVPTAPRDPNEFLARAAQKDKDSAAMEQMHQQLNPEIVPTKMKPPVPEYAGIPRPNGGTTMGEGHTGAPSAAQRNIGRANEAIANATTPRTGNEVPVENQVAPEDALLAETQSNNPAQAAIDNIQSAREGRDTGQPQGADAPFDPKRQAEPDELEERQNELLDEQLNSTMQIVSGPVTRADQQILSADAEQGGEASQFTESTTDKYVKEMRANENSRFADVARRYADDVKKSPWYKDNRLWGAVLGFGLARLAGADPRMGMMMAGMTAGVINKDNVDYLRTAKLRNEEDWDKHDEYLQKLSETAYNAKMEQQNYDRDLGDKRADMADTRKYNQGVTSAKNRFTSEQNQLDRDSREEQARLKRNQTLRIGQAKLTDSQKSRLKVNEKRMSELSDRSTNNTASIEKAKQILEGIETGGMDTGTSEKWADKLIPGVWTKQGEFNEQFNSFTEKAAREALKQAGEIRPTDADVKGMKESMFGVGKDENTNKMLLREFIANAEADREELIRLQEAADSDGLSEYRSSANTTREKPGKKSKKNADLYSKADAIINGA